jgi:trimethylamine--corrinoid protein Co-methyltransferase
MYGRWQNFTEKELTNIHDASMDLLKNIGVAFNDDEALGIFKKNGFKVDGYTVFFSEKNVRQAIESAPARFRVVARNPANTVSIGGDGVALAPGYGAAFIITRDGEQRKATMADYDIFCKLVQTSRTIDITGFLMAAPSDLPAETAHLNMLYANITLCDKPFMGSPVSRAGAEDCINMASMVWGGKEKLKETPVTISLITPLSPLRYTPEMAGSVITLARYNQACTFGALLMAGASGPLSIAGVLVQQNAEILAGVTLTQLVRPGAPVIVGGTSAIMDMRTGCLSMGAPEVARISSATIQMAQFYNLPARSGCANTDAHFPNAQAGFESALNLYVALQNGSNFILHAAGILGAYNAMSFEKFIIDEEICSQILESLKPITITDESIDLDLIKEVGIGGNYLTHPKTYEQCRTAFYLSNLVNRNGFSGWQEEGAKHITDTAAEILNERMSEYVKPDIDPQLEKDLLTYIQNRRQGSDRQA